MTREEIEKKAVERFPTEPFRAFSDDYSRKMYCQRKDEQQAYIEGALMVVEAYAQQQVKSDVAEVVKSKCKTCNGKKLRRESDGSIVICLDC
jgi:hypothetical protein